MFGKSHHWLWIFVVLVLTLSFPVVVRAQATFDALVQDLQFLRENSEAVLLFNVFGDNPDFRKHMLSDDQIADICQNNEVCDGFGANFATFFAGSGEGHWDDAEDNGFNWALQIANASDPNSVSSTINAHPTFNVIVRFGTGAGGSGFGRPETIVSFIKTVAGQTSRPFFAIAGPNEPDLEPWAVDSYGEAVGTFPSTGTEQQKRDWYTKTGTKLATYMRTICEAKASGEIPAHVSLLSPAFNATSESFVPLVEEVQKNGGFVQGCFAGMAINLYPAGNSMVSIWEEKGIGDLVGLPIYVTETGPISQVFYNPSSDDDDTPDDAPGFRPTEGEGRPNSGDTTYHYISPLMGLYPKAARNVPEIRDSLANQGYQAYCATPTYTIEQQFGGDIEAFIANVRAGKHAPRRVDVGSSEIIDYNTAMTPIFRDTERKAFLKADMEEFFGYRELDEDTYAQTEIESAPINSLLSEHQKCMKSADALLAQRTMCNKLGVRPNETCALYYTVVPGTEIDILELYNKYTTFKAGRTDQEACHSIAANEMGDNVLSATEFTEFRTAMLNASLHLEKAYRIAFLVGVVRQKPEDPNFLFNFFSKTSTVPPPDEVVVISFKIPDIGTNKGSTFESETVTGSQGQPLYDRVARDGDRRKIEKAESGHTFWDDVMTLTRNILIPRRIAEKMDLEGTKEREELRAAAADATDQNAGSLIYCLTGQAPYGSGSATCNDEAVKAVVDIINGTWIHDKPRVSCDPANLTNEKVDEIGDPAALATAGDNYKFQEQYGEFILSQIWDTNSADRNNDFQTVFQVDSKNWPPDACNVLDQGQGAIGDCTTINFYLVYPMGYDLETLEYVLARTFLTKDQFEAASQDPDIKNRFNIFDDTVELTADTAEEDFTDFLDCSFDDDGRYTCAEKEFTATVVSTQGPALFLGARVGYWIHEIQKGFNRLDSLAHKYLRTCRTTEEFLLDQCGGAPDDENFDDKAYCQGKPDKSPIIRDVNNTMMDRFKFSTNTGKVVEEKPIETPMEDEDNNFFPKPGELGCTMKFAVRAVDGLTLILSGGQNIVPNNPGNILGCTGRVSAARKLRVLRLPPEYGAAQKAVDPNWKPAPNNPAWDTAEVMRTAGSTASEIQYELQITRGYYKVEIVITNSICQSDHTWVMQDGEELDGDSYVFDFVNNESCQAGACFDANLQPNMEGGGPVMGMEDGKEVVLYTIDVANDYLQNAFGCDLNFQYSTLKYNNTCGGGRAGDCDDPGIGGDCGFWHNLIDQIRNGTTIGGKRGSDAYYSVFGRYPDANGVVSCVDEDNGDPIFGNTIVIRQCESYSNSLDSLRIFGKIIGFPIEWFMTQEEVEFEIPSREVWDAIQAASKKHGCDPWLVLALASSEGEEPGYFNDTRPNQAQTIGMFEFLPDIWADWTRDNNPNDAQCTWRQPGSFNAENKNGLNFSDRTNIPAAVDTACRIILYSGMQKYPEDEKKFAGAFMGLYEEDQPQENNYSLGWNANPLQARYVYQFWQKARTAAEEGAKPQPGGYPYNICTGGEQPTDPPPTPPTGEPPPPTTNTGTPPTPQEINSWTDEQWKEFWHYDQRSVLPVVGRVTYQAQSATETVLRNRQNLFNELSKDAIYTCTLDYSQGGGDPMRTLQSLQEQAASNGSSRAIGCAASLRLGDMSFRPTGDPDNYRTVWVKPKDGVFKNTSIGPIMIMDVGAVKDLQYIYETHGATYLLDIGQPLFQFILSGYGAWNGPQDMIVCDTKEQCDNTTF